MNFTVIVCLIVCLFCVLAGYLLCKGLLLDKTTGEIVMHEDSIYLNINKEDIDNFKDGNFVLMRIKRRNFNGFNEE